MRPDMHAGSVEVAEPWSSFLCLATDKIFGCCKKFLVYCFHTFLGERSGIFNDLFTYSAKLRIDSCIIFIGCFAFQHATRAEFFLEVWIFWVVRDLWFFFRV